MQRFNHSTPPHTCSYLWEIRNPPPTAGNPEGRLTQPTRSHNPCPRPPFRWCKRGPFPATSFSSSVLYRPLTEKGMETTVRSQQCDDDAGVHCQEHPASLGDVLYTVYGC
ncbi:hypothetical protein CFRS1_v010335 [Colletotrichum fructicola]|nr:hypothetical protein CFRS1_v010335 [Colletotrichum fructicola]